MRLPKIIEVLNYMHFHNDETFFITKMAKDLNGGRANVSKYFYFLLDEGYIKKVNQRDQIKYYVLTETGEALCKSLPDFNKLWEALLNGKL